MRDVIRNAIYLGCCAAASPIVLSYWLLSLFADRDGLVAGYSQLLSLFPGKLGDYLRKAALGFMIARCDRDCLVSFGVLLSHRDTEIEAGVYIGPHSNIGKCRIEKNCILGSGVHVMSGRRQHAFADLDTPIRDQGGSFEKIAIGEDSWIGNGALILASVGKQCVVGAGAVVLDAVPDFSIVAGNPARVVRKRR
jgi:virginiamycin A acetyltransferase